MALFFFLKICYTLLMNLKNLSSQQFGRLTVVSLSHKKPRFKNGKLVSTRIYWLCLCTCGKKKIVKSDSLKAGFTKSCGCLNSSKSSKRAIERNYKHGFFGSRFYRIWIGMRYRCSNPKHTHYKRYGGRGIKCLWQTFQEFHKDMYLAYLKHCTEFGEKQTTLDRINNNGNYEVSNCRWATYSEQALNR